MLQTSKESKGSQVPLTLGAEAQILCLARHMVTEGKNGSDGTAALVKPTALMLT